MVPQDHWQHTFPIVYLMTSGNTNRCSFLVGKVKSHSGGGKDKEGRKRETRKILFVGADGCMTFA
jgi:hypothetical protein